MALSTIAVRFRQGDFDFLYMRVRAFGPVLPDKTTAKSVTCRISSLYCPFRALLRWLEASATGVDECAFGWDGEGPDARLAWDGAFLELEYWGGGKRTVFRQRADRKQVARAIYTAFRRFVESSRFDPDRYERPDKDEPWSAHRHMANGDLLRTMRSEAVERWIGGS